MPNQPTSERRTCTRRNSVRGTLMKAKLCPEVVIVGTSQPVLRGTKPEIKRG
jgi:hypothetical protein